VPHDLKSSAKGDDLIVMNRRNGVEKMRIMDRLRRRKQIEELAKRLEKTSGCV
jgi:hypothetical protein